MVNTYVRVSTFWLPDRECRWKPEEFSAVITFSQIQLSRCWLSALFLVSPAISSCIRDVPYLTYDEYDKNNNPVTHRSISVHCMYFDRWLLLRSDCYSECCGEIWPLAVDTLFQTRGTFYVVFSGKAFFPTFIYFNIIKISSLSLKTNICVDHIYSQLFIFFYFIEFILFYIYTV